MITSQIKKFSNILQGSIFLLLRVGSLYEYHKLIFKSRFINVKKSIVGKILTFIEMKKALVKNY